MTLPGGAAIVWAWWPILKSRGYGAPIFPMEVTAAALFVASWVVR